ncbi:MAG TPA: hypothetical protein VJS85_09275 [Rhizomicrobium sp.]|nr:hypothetical protein [Rhizomicrobium sp.]
MATNILMPALSPTTSFVMPAQAGIQLLCLRAVKESWIPAFAGMTVGGV